MNRELYPWLRFSLYSDVLMKPPAPKSGKQMSTVMVDAYSENDKETHCSAFNNGLIPRNRKTRNPLKNFSSVAEYRR